MPYFPSMRRKRVWSKTCNFIWSERPSTSNATRLEQRKKSSLVVSSYQFSDSFLINKVLLEKASPRKNFNSRNLAGSQFWKNPLDFGYYDDQLQFLALCVCKKIWVKKNLRVFFFLFLNRTLFCGWKHLDLEIALGFFEQRRASGKYCFTWDNRQVSACQRTHSCGEPQKKWIDVTDDPDGREE